MTMLSKQTANLAASAAVVVAALVLEGCGDAPAPTPAPLPLTCPSTGPGTGERMAGPMGFTNDTGLNGSVCLDICAGPGAVVIPDGKTAVFDWDYLVLDHIYTPQLCRAIQQEDAPGPHDPTLPNVEGVSCERTDAPLFAIHGLWNNYFSGYTGCCDRPSPLTVATPDGWSSDLMAGMKAQWPDVAVAEGCDTCFTWNHEWQKHGGCIASSHEAYFQMALDLSALIEPGLKALTDALRERAGSFYSVTEAVAVYRNAMGSEEAVVNLVCDPKSIAKNDGSEQAVWNYVSEFAVCWKRKSGVAHGVPVTAADLVPYECPPAGEGSFYAPCPGNGFAVADLPVTAAEEGLPTTV